MRHATQHTRWILSPQGKLQGISLGIAPGPDHAQGLDPLREALGLALVPAHGVVDRMIQRLPSTWLFGHYAVADASGIHEPRAWLLLTAPQYGRTSIKPPLTEAERAVFFSQVPFAAGAGLSCAWDQAGCLIHARGPVALEHLETLRKALEKKEWVLAEPALLTPEQARDTAGPIWMLVDALDPKAMARILAQDKSQARLRQAVAQESIAELLRAHGIAVVSLRPRWEDAREARVVYDLEPLDAKHHLAGTYRAEDLLEWMQGRGPVMRDNALDIHRARLAPFLEKWTQELRTRQIAVPNLSVQWADTTKKAVVVVLDYAPHAPAEAGLPQLAPGRYSATALATLEPALPAEPLIASARPRHA